MTVIACYILHYGKEWLKWSMRSVAPYVDGFLVSYTDQPSHGHGTDLRCHETEEDLKTIVRGFAHTHRVHWTKNRFNHEGQHRESAVQDCVNMGADVVLVVDADEIWEPRHLAMTLAHVRNDINMYRGGRYHSYRVPFRHFWKSTSWVCNDPAQPTRVIVPHVRDNSEGYIPAEYGMVNHFGYAQSSNIVWYKMHIHGHKAEWRQEWWSEKFIHWQPGVIDVHPTNHDFWNPEPFDEKKLYHLIGDHPYYGLDIIT